MQSKLFVSSFIPLQSVGESAPVINVIMFGTLLHGRQLVAPVSLWYAPISQAMQLG